MQQQHLQDNTYAKILRLSRSKAAPSYMHCACVLIMIIACVVLDSVQILLIPTLQSCYIRVPARMQFNSLRVHSVPYRTCKAMYHACRTNQWITLAAMFSWLNGRSRRTTFFAFFGHTSANSACISRLVSGTGTPRNYVEVGLATAAASRGNQRQRTAEITIWWWQQCSQTDSSTRSCTPAAACLQGTRSPRG
jgi:hypothetical protein